MTCIIGMIGKNNDRVIIGADEMTSSNLGDIKLTYPDNRYVEKIWKVSENPNIILAATGDVGLIEQFKYHCKFQSEEELEASNQLFDKKYIHYNLIDKLNMETNRKNAKFQIMIGYKNKIFIVNILDGIVDEIEGSGAFTSIGTGRHYAEASLIYSNKYIKDKSEELEIGKALQISSEKCTTVAPPLYIANNIDNRVYEFDDRSSSVYITDKEIEKV